MTSRLEKPFDESPVQEQMNEAIPAAFDYNVPKFTVIKLPGDIIPQNLRVDYLPNDRVLFIPAADPTKSEASHDATLLEVVSHVYAMSYAEIKALVQEGLSVAETRARVMAVTATSLANIPEKWMTDDFYVEAQNVRVSRESASSYFEVISRVLGLNCDVRDLGFLVMDQSQSRLKDDAWIGVDTAPQDRLREKVHGHTLEAIAALNMPACENFHIGAWVRALGVGCGLLPHPSTKLNQQWKFTQNEYAAGSLTAVLEARKFVGTQLLDLCLNILGMFGLFHLNKNHTYKTGDTNMKRICRSYVQTLKVMVPASVMEKIEQHMEVICRTAPHPFGLGQTYFVALMLSRINSLASPLVEKLDVCPPPVQRLMIIEAATKEWTRFPKGLELNSSYAQLLGPIEAEIKTIRASPPSFSELAPLYGLPETKKISNKIKESADALMPMISGYVNAMHIDKNKKKHGLALALSVQNVARVSPCLTSIHQKMWASIWTKPILVL